MSKIADFAEVQLPPQLENIESIHRLFQNPFILGSLSLAWVEKFRRDRMKWENGLESMDPLGHKIDMKMI